MTLSRKEFFRQGFFTLGDTLLKTAGVVAAADTPEPVDEQEKLEDGQPRLARADNSRCLARSCGCFSCVERCESQAISILPGVGIGIADELCTGCGDCYEVCPVTPKAIRLVSAGSHEKQQA